MSNRSKRSVFRLHRSEIYARESRGFSFEFFIPPVALRQIVLSRARKVRNETRLAKRKNTECRCNIYYFAARNPTEIQDRVKRIKKSILQTRYTCTNSVILPRSNFAITKNYFHF